ncbi:MAG: type II toxin-antitoxin system RelE/ParE family toxin [Terriglobia bacterium]
MLDLLMTSGDPGTRLLSDLKESIPEHGPPKNPEASKPLRDKILELREPVIKGGTLRVLYFYDKGRILVCANGILKKTNKTPDELIDAAIAIRAKYLAAVRKGELEIIDLPAEGEDGEDNGVH